MSALRVSLRRIAVIAVLVAALAALAAHRIALTLSFDALGARGEQLVALVGETLESELERVAALPAALAQFAELAEIDRDGDLRPLNLLLEKVALESGVRDLIVLDYVGVAIAASNWDASRSVIGQRYGFRPFYFEALLFGRGSHHALEATSEERGFYFSYAFRSKVDGQRYVLVARIAAQRLEASWGERPIVGLFDPNGVVFLSSEPRLHFASDTPLRDATRELLAQNRQYERVEILALPAVADRRIDDWRFIRASAPSWRDFGIPNKELLVIERPLASDAAGLGGFTLRAWLDTVEARRAALLAAAGGGLLMLLLAFGALGLIARRRAALLRLRTEERAKIELERRVEERTAELRRVEANLAQAQRLAALGRFAADVSHEVNQPLAAIRAYAENAEAFLARGKADAAGGNLARIAVMSERLSRIIANLRLFARGEAPPPRPTLVSDAFEQALEVAAARIEAAGAEVKREGDAWSAMVMAGSVRLQQVFVNLLSNAADAVQGQPARVVTVRAQEAGGVVELIVADTGPGFTDEMLSRAFDPFVTGKGMEAGPGLGLGLSIVYGMVIAAGGSVKLRNGAERGAEAVVTLAVAPASRRAEGKEAVAARPV